MSKRFPIQEFPYSYVTSVVTTSNSVRSYQRGMCRWLVNTYPDTTPLCPNLLFWQYITDEVNDPRIEPLTDALIKKCKYVVIGTNQNYSANARVQREIEIATKYGKDIYFYNSSGGGSLNPTPTF